ncbi:flagellar hook assembly protein FlgD [Pseudomonas sp. SLFW]|uniref:flagellar hook assembly protein FlgD n=1 Tax=Pseudomonas sp. SLFW TaxID=2683259 RepID=UPI0014132C5A|nr:flagellar hook assembly protein FlgD [Pseudomonas sp. SLFW]NBB09822.1 flagellar biosynthesis protein FlgD [Pseudomonas sp. SLFW]
MTTSVNNTTSADYINSLQKPTSGKTGDATTGASSLGKDAFLKLLVTQMQNQNPLDPQDNTQFVAQLAQFSSLENMQNLSTSVDAIGGMYQSSQALQAASLVGRTVIVDSGSTYSDSGKGVAGAINLPALSTLTAVKVYDAKGTLVRTLNLGEKKAGETSFTWDGKDEAGNTLDSGKYSFVATGSIEGKSTTLKTFLPDKITSVAMGTASSPMTLNLADGTNVGLSKIQKITL